MFDGDVRPERIVDDTLVDRIKWTTIARVVLLTTVLLFAVTLDLEIAVRPRTQAPATEATLYQITTVFYGLSFAALVFAQLLRDNPGLRFLAFASVAMDVALGMMLVTTTDGLQSLFLFAFPLAVLNSALVLRRAGAMTAATLSSLALAVMALVHLGWWAVPLIPAWSATPTSDVFLQLSVQVAAVYGTSFLSTYLVRELDASRQKALRQRVELSRLRLRYADVVSSLPDGLMTVGVGGVVTGVNPAGAHILGQDVSRTLGQPVGMVLPELESLEHGEVEIARSGSLTRTHELHRGRPGQPAQILACRVAPLHESVDSMLPVGRLVVFRDVTMVRQQEETHRDRERLAAVGSMAMAVAHEIRNPLASISGAVQMLESSPDLSDTDKQLMEIVQRETLHLSDWIGEFLDFAKPRALQTAPVDLRGVVTEVLGALAHDPRVQEGKVRLECVVAEAGIDPQSAATQSREFLLMGDAALLRQTVWNLVINAAQAVMGEALRVVRVTLEARETDIRLTVDDSGPGLPPGDLPHIFEPFYTTKGGGTGLGLATVKRHITAHRGEIAVDVSPLGGARFVVTLPRRPSTDAVFSWTREMPAANIADAETAQDAQTQTGRGA